jgi:ADP-ribose pyrophosphatase
MSDFDSDDCLARYRALVRAQPEEFVNPPGDIYEILLSPDRIAHAQGEALTHRRAHGMTIEDTRVGVVAIDPYLTVLRDAVRFADGSYGLYNRLIVPSGTAVLPLSGNDIALLHRFRHGTRRWHLEIPRGSCSGVGTLADEATRELREEIGATATELIDLGELHSTTGVFNEMHQLFLARIDGIGTPDKHEAIASIQMVPVDRVERLIATAELTDGPTLATFLRARLRGYL